MAVAEVFGAGADAQLAVQGVLRISAVIISAAYCQSQPGGVIFAGKVVAGDQNVGAVVKFMQHKEDKKDKLVSPLTVTEREILKLMALTG